MTKEDLPSYPSQLLFRTQDDNPFRLGKRLQNLGHCVSVTQKNFQYFFLGDDKGPSSIHASVSAWIILGRNASCPEGSEKDDPTVHKEATEFFDTINELIKEFLNIYRNKIDKNQKGRQDI